MSSTRFSSAISLIVSYYARRIGKHTDLATLMVTSLIERRNKIMELSLVASGLTMLVVPKIHADETATR